MREISFLGMAITFAIPELFPCAAYPFFLFQTIVCAISRGG